MMEVGIQSAYLGRGKEGIDRRGLVLRGTAVFIAE